jgi:hypothetical protein
VCRSHVDEGEGVCVGLMLVDSPIVGTQFERK